MKKVSLTAAVLELDRQQAEREKAQMSRPTPTVSEDAVERATEAFLDALDADPKRPWFSEEFGSTDLVIDGWLDLKAAVRAALSVSHDNRMREALEPFARALDYAEREFGGVPCDDTPIVEFALDEAPQAEITFGDLRRARTALGQEG